MSQALLLALGAQRPNETQALVKLNVSWGLTFRVQVGGSERWRQMQREPRSRAPSREKEKALESLGRISVFCFESYLAPNRSLHRDPPLLWNVLAAVT